MENPEGQGFRRPFGKDDEELEELDEIVEEDLAIDRFGPGLDVSEKLGWARGVLSGSGAVAVEGV